MPKLPRWNAAEAETELLKRFPLAARIATTGRDPIPRRSGSASEDRKAGDRSFGVDGLLTIWAVVAREEDFFNFVSTHRLIPSGPDRHKSARTAENWSRVAISE